MNHWFAVHTHPNGEVRAVVNLRQQGYSTYLPVHMKKRRHARRVEFVKRPLFSRYLFVQLDPELDQWRAINSTFGVSHVVTNGSAPAALPKDFVADLSGHEDSNGVIILDHQTHFVSGQRLEIIDGPMMDHVGVFARMSDKDRVVILLELLNRSTPVTLPLKAVMPA